MFLKLKQNRDVILHILWLFILLFTAIYFSNSQHPIRLMLQHGVFDEFNKYHTRPRSNKLVIVDIDEKSLEQLGQWPWPRYIMASLTNSLTEKGAKAIAFDGVFAEEDRTSPLHILDTIPTEDQSHISKFFDKNQDRYDYDALFTNAIKNSNIFVTAFTYGREVRIQTKPYNKNKLLARSDVKTEFLQKASKFNAAATNLKPFSKAAAGNGSFMAKADSDGVLRRAGMIFTDGKALYPSLSLEALRVALAGRKGFTKLARVPSEKSSDIDTNYRILIDEIKIPVESDGILYVHYRHFCNEEDVEHQHFNCSQADYLPAYKLLDPTYAEQAHAAIKDKIVLIGASAEGLKDLRNTALRPFIPGVEVHANVIEQIMQNDYLLRPKMIKGVEAIFILVIGLLFILLAPFVGILISLALCLSIIIIAIFSAFYAYAVYGILVDPVYASLSVLTIFIVSTILSYARTEAKRKQIRNAFGMYVAHDVMRDLERNPEKLKLGGENRELTVMFTDIRKFTAISEGLTPEELIGLMNEFLTNMTDSVMKHHGTVDKYIGDAMMSFWNAPRDVDNHAREACLAALEMQKALEPINKRIQENADADKTPILLNAGIGINSGVCAVGNMGSKQRFAYSALGDAVNLASRLEGQTKQYGTAIIVGQDTYEQANDLAMIELDHIKVVGREQATKIYGLFGDTHHAQEASFQKWREDHMLMLQAYRNQDFQTAKQLITNCEIHAPNLYEMYVKRIKQLEKIMLPKSWDGVFEAEEK